MNPKIKYIFFVILVVVIPLIGKANNDPIQKNLERTFSEKKFDSLKKKKEYKAFLKYETPINKDESKLRIILLKMLQVLMGNRIIKFLLTLIPYLLIIAAIVLIALRLSNVEFSKLFKPNIKTKNPTFIYESENINEIDIEQLLNDALNAKEYRLAIRYNYLRILKLLSDQSKIKWEVYKTNYEYQYELKEEKYHDLFCKLTSYFELMWYGEFNVDFVKYYNESVSLAENIKEELGI